MPKNSQAADFMYTPPWGRCRFCKESVPQSEMVKYGVRHHAHPACLYRNRGIEAINALHTWQLRHLPILVMMEAGVTLDQVREWQARIETEDAERTAHDATSTSDEDDLGEDA